MVSHSDEINRFAYGPKDRTDELSGQHRTTYKLNSDKDVLLYFARVSRSW